MGDATQHRKPSTGKAALMEQKHPARPARRHRSRSHRKSKKRGKSVRFRSRSRSRSRSRTKYQEDLDHQMPGIVTFYDHSRGYGFINQNYFFTYDSIVVDQSQTQSQMFQDGVPVRFTLQEQPRLKYHRAVLICSKNGQPFAPPSYSSFLYCPTPTEQQPVPVPATNPYVK